jgi:hypothetical protein
MQANSSQRPSGREDKPLQRAVLALVLHEYPAQLTREDLKHKGLGQADPIDFAVENLAHAGLCGARETLWVQPSPPATLSGWRRRDGRREIRSQPRPSS